ncbi:MAG: ribosome recycling factor [Patescibacteria group bacterium]|nr:ribosome recycling factor [Patescibacteria group bacterium]
MPNNLNEQLKKVVEFFSNDLKALRVGRANPALVENIIVKYYGTKTPLIQLASITVADAHTLVIQPWDKNSFKDVEQALNQADLGGSPVANGEILRLSIPPMTEERRLELVKIVKEKAEKSKVSIRMIREDEIKLLKNKKDNGEISEDVFFNKQKETQKTIDETVKEISELEQAKQEEITKI